MRGSKSEDHTTGHANEKEVGLTVASFPSWQLFDLHIYIERDIYKQ
jgi:hypothetical protein